MKRKWPKQITKQKIFIVVLVLLVVGMCIAISIQTHLSKPSTSVSDYDMSKMRDTTEKNTDKIYKKTETKADTNASETALNDHLNLKKKNTYATMMYHIINVLENKKKEDAEKLLNRDAITKKGYEFDTGAISNLKNTFGKDFKVMPVRYISFSKYCYCIAKVAPRVVYDNGESGVDYKKYKEVTFTIFKDGTFLHFALESVYSAKDVHRIREGKDAVTTPNPDLIEGSPDMPGIDDVDEPGM